jgi:hypothetical protein
MGIFDGLVSALNAGVQSYTEADRYQKEQEYKRKLDEQNKTFQNRQMTIAENADTRAADEAKRIAEANKVGYWEDVVSEKPVVNNIDLTGGTASASEQGQTTSTERTTTRVYRPGGIDYESKNFDNQLKIAQAEALRAQQNKPLDIGASINAYNESILVNKNVDGKIVPRSKEEIDADMTRAYSRWYGGIVAGKSESGTAADKTQSFKPTDLFYFDKNMNIVGQTSLFNEARNKAISDLGEKAVPIATIRKLYENNNTKELAYTAVEDIANQLVNTIGYEDAATRQKYYDYVVNRFYADIGMEKPSASPTIPPANGATPSTVAQTAVKASLVPGVVPAAAALAPAAIATAGSLAVPAATGYGIYRGVQALRGQPAASPGEAFQAVGNAAKSAVGAVKNFVSPPPPLVFEDWVQSRDARGNLSGTWFNQKENRNATPDEALRLLAEYNKRMKQ